MSNSAWSGARPHIDESELLCKTGCGYYGNPTWDGHCSKCYKELVQKREQRKTVFDPTQIKNKVTQSVSDVSELQSKATSLMTRKFDKFDEKRRRQMDKKTKAVRSIFMKSHSTKEKESKDHPKVTRQLSEESQAAVTEFQKFFETISKESQHLISKHIKSFMDKSLTGMESLSVDEMGDLVHDFYNSINDLMAKNSCFKNFTNEQIEKVGELTEVYITTRLYKILIGEVNAYSEEKDLAIQKRIRSLMWVSTSHLECKVDESNTEVRVLLDEIITDLIEIDSKRVPSAKLRLLVSASHQVLNLLKKSSGGSPASADDFLPALIFCVIRANPPLLQSNICYVTNFAQQSCLQSGEAGYFFTNLCCAVSFIEKLTADSLGLTQPEFERYMSGDALPPNALDGTYMCDGMQLMQQNLDNLSELEIRLNEMLESYDSIMNNMEEFKKENLIQEVDKVLERTPLIIRPRKANIDDNDPAQELLPPPLMPQSLKTEEKHQESHDGSSSLILPFDGLKTPEQMLDSGTATPLLSSDIVAAQESLNFLQGLEASYVDSFSGDLDSLQGTSDPFLQQDALLNTSYNSQSFDPFASLDSSFSSDKNSRNTSVMEVRENEDYSPLSSSIRQSNISPSFRRSPQFDGTPAYTGFSAQGERIPSIPCVTGFSHYAAAPLDPLSPPLDGPATHLPPPLVPISNTDSRNCKKTDDTSDKLGNVVSGIDNLI
ncbi:UNVERIFIED_CONTAM: hypothetical protein RMT77_004946 [Armadillidium vulgare]